jgi:hypothetical protein
MDRQKKFKVGGEVTKKIKKIGSLPFCVGQIINVLLLHQACPPL